MAQLRVLQEHRDCRACPLGKQESLRNPGIATRLWDGHRGKWPGKRKALVFVGESPGLAEDRQGKSYVGLTGIHANGTYVKMFGLDRYADVWWANALRCCPNEITSTTISHVKKCRPHLEADVAALAAKYDEVILVAAGAKGIQALQRKAIGIGRYPQGSYIDIGGTRCITFATNLPAVLLPGKSPSKIVSIMDHLLMVRRYLETGQFHGEVVIPEVLTGDEVPDPVAPEDGLVVFDIETYGYVEGFPAQTAFHPAKMLMLDKIPLRDMVTTCSLTWKEGDELRTKVYRIWVPSDVDRLLGALGRCRGLTLVGHNSVFDVCSLRALGARWRAVLHPDRCTLEDTQVWNFLDSDQRPERSLKQLVLLFGITDYHGELNLRRGERYPTRDDPRFISYNAKDTIATWALREITRRNIAERYGPDTDKLKPRAQRWWSDQLWSAVEMAENGIDYDRKRLRRYLGIIERHIERRVAVGDSRWGITMSGKGSDASLREWMTGLVQRWAPKAGPEARQFQKDLKFTKGRKMAIDANNVNLLRRVVPATHPDAKALRWLARLKDALKVRDSYLKPMLGMTGKEKKRPAALVGARAFPTWYVVPGRESDESDREGGTQQIRMAAQNHAVQTEPPKIEAMRVSRWGRKGALVSLDESQVELRIPILFSGDPRMMEVFVKGINLHKKTADMFLGWPVDKKKHPLEYLLGKTLNFARLFGAGATKLQAVGRCDLGLEFSREKCQGFLDADRQEYKVLYEWQDELVREARANGYLTVPISGASRTFLGDLESQRPTILNIKVQATAAMVTQSAQHELSRMIRREGWPVLPIANVHDEGIYDCHGDFAEEFASLALPVFRNPPVWQELLALPGMHPVPLDAEAKILYNHQ